MKPLIFTSDWTHYGICKHHAAIHPDRIVIIEAMLFSCDMKHKGLWIGRFADAPWDLLQRDEPGFTWHTVVNPSRN